MMVDKRTLLRQSQKKGVELKELATGRNNTSCV